MVCEGDRSWSPHVRMLEEMPVELCQLADYLEVPVATLYAWRYRREGPPGGSAERWIVIKPHLELRAPIGFCWGADPLVSRLGPPTWPFGRTTGKRAEAEWRNSWTSCF